MDVHVREAFMALTLKPGRVFRHRGGSLLEAAIVLPVLIYVAFGTVEFGYYFYVKHSLDGAAREGARAGIVSGATYANITTAITNCMTACTLSNSGYTTVVQDNGTTISTMSSAVTGDEITVTVSCNWGTVGSGYRLWGFIGTSKTLVGAAVMRHE
jgi:Flp pilus assembly protein TadG